MKKVKELKNSKELKELKEKWVQEQGGLCPILKLPFNLDDYVIDHLHTSAKEEPDEISGKGFCRGAIHHNANVVEGKILKDFIRYGLVKYIDVPTFLRNLADYLENNRFHSEDEIYIHPTERIKKPILSKISYNELVKKNNGKYKIPPYQDKRGNFNKRLVELFKKFDIEPRFKK